MKTTTFLTTCAIFAIAASALAETRYFTNSAGKTITAELVKVDGANAILSIDGKEYPVAVNSLSTKDQAYIQEWNTAQQAAAEEAKAAAEANRSQLLKELEGELVLLDGRDLEEFGTALPFKDGGNHINGKALPFKDGGNHINSTLTVY